MSEGTTAEIAIIRRSVLQVAPDALFFEVIVDGFEAATPNAGQIYDSRFHDLYYFWDFDDPYDFQAPENLPRKHLNAGVAYGPWVSHTFRTPGSYRVSVFVIEPASGKTATASTDIVIGDPGAVFQARNTVFLSPSGNFEYSPPRARRLATDDISSVFKRQYCRARSCAQKDRVKSGRRIYLLRHFTWVWRTYSIVPYCRRRRRC